MKIFLSSSYVATVQGELLGYVGENNSRKIQLYGYETEGASRYELIFSYFDEAQYEVDITSGEYTIPASVLREPGNVDIQVVALTPSGEFIKKSNIVKGVIEASVNGESQPIPPYEDVEDMYEQILESAENAVGASRVAQESAQAADISKTEAEAARDTAVAKSQEIAGSAEQIEKNVEDISQLSESINELYETVNGMFGFIEINWTNGNYVRSDGTVISSSSYADTQYSDYIDLDNSDLKVDYTIKTMLNGFAYACLFDKNYQLIVAVKYGNASTFGEVEINTADYENVKYARLSNKIGYNATILMNSLSDISIKRVDFSKIDNVMITKDQTDFVKKFYGINLFDKDADDKTLGKIITDNGSYSTASYSNVSGFTEVEANTQYIHRYDNYMGSKSATTAFYTADKELIDVITATINSTDKTVTFTTPSNCQYVKMNVLVNGSLYIEDSFMLVKGNKIPDVYVAYREPWYELIGVEFNTTELEANLNPLYGKKIVFDGDSICASNAQDDPQNGWAGRIGVTNNMDWKNYGVGGGTITKNVSTTSHWICTSLDTIHSENPTVDYYIFEGGTNDADIFAHDGDTRLGTFDLDDYTGNYDDTTFCGAFEKICFNALKYYPHAKIGYIIAPKMGMTTDGFANFSIAHRKKYFDKAMEICKKWGIPYINLWDESTMNPELRSQYVPPKDITGNNDVTDETIAYNVRNGKLYRDGQHPTALGYDIMHERINSFIKSL